MTTVTDPVQGLIDTICFGMFRDFVAYLNANPNVTGMVLGTELNSLRQTYTIKINQGLTLLGWPSNSQNAYINFNNYANQLQMAINYFAQGYPNGHTSIANIPLPAGSGSSMAKNIEQICQAYQNDANQLQTLQKNWQDLQKLYAKVTSPTSQEQAAFTTIQSEMTPLAQQLSTLSTIVAASLKASTASSLAFDNSKMASKSQLFVQQLSAAQVNINNLSNLITPTPVEGNVYSLLKTKGVTYTIINNLTIPYGGMRDGFSASEAWGYSVRNAVANNDPTFASALWNSYYHYCFASLAWMQAHSVYDQRWPTLGFGTYKFGMMGWHVNQTTADFKTEGDEVSATDADADILHSLLDYVDINPGLVIQDPTSINTTTLKNLTSLAVMNFAQCNLIMKSGDYGVTLDNWGDQSPHPDYYDPTLLQKGANYAASWNLVLADGTSVASVYNQASANEMKRIDAQIATYQTIGDQYESTYMTAEGLRFLMRFGQYISWSGVDKTSSLFKSAVNALKSTVQYLFANNRVQLNHSFGPGYISMDLNGMAQGQASGPVLLALKALQANNALPANVTDAIITTVQNAFAADMANQFSGISSWTYQDYENNGNYFGLELIILSKAIMEQNKIYPKL